MKLDKQLIRDSFAMFTDMPDSELSYWSILCDNAESMIISHLRENVDARRNMERLCIAAAALAYSDYAAILSGKSGSSGEIRVGDISLRNSGDEFEAASTRDYFIASVSDLIDVPTGFVFQATENTL